MVLVRLALVSLAIAALSACPRLPPLDYGKDGPAADGATLLRRLELADAQVISVKGDAKLFIDSAQGKGSVPLYVAVLHPAHLHLELLDFFGRPEAILVTDGERFSLYDSRQKKFFKGPATAENMGRLVPIALPPRELASLLLGRVPRVPPESSELSIDEARRVYQLTLKRGPVVQKLDVTTGTHRVVRSRVEGLATYGIDADDVTVFGAASLAKQLTLSAPSAGVRVELAYKEIVVNETPEVTLFELEPPPGVPVVEVQGNGEVAPAP